MKRLTKTIRKEYNNKYYVVYREGSNLGLCSYLMTGLGAIYYSLRNNRIPVMLIDNKNLGSKDKDINYWNLFFQQPCGEEIDCWDNRFERISGENVLRPNLSMDFLTNDRLVKFWRALCHKYIRMRQSFEAECSSTLSVITGNVDLSRTIGVLCRGTDYVRLRPLGHPVQADSKTMIEKIEKKLNELDIDNIFLVTEDEIAKKALINTFGKRVIFSENNDFSNYSNGYLNENIRNDKIIEVWKKYYKNIYILSNCRYIQASRTSGSIMALLMASDNVKAEFINIGTYGVDDDTFYDFDLV